ncbi:MAG TPA: C4-type zinc ribbon domain-containing protein [Spirochaetia bacterium]|nr:C4-type zinc ribbon domain-containing protein [Spirochaetales bacterium]HPD80081.1 C4-type zinc ribbon domain-containing protein [Spirochaetales bacterium]HRS64286.1 C4-type zinc ribbon domain-containing protein [Spirochaetia bacterium]HRV27581.1 C4-type zinc ribbon domain-containing protein [Spirochaetia bacterium]
MEELLSKLNEFQKLLIERVNLEHELVELPKSLITQEEILTRTKKNYQDKKAIFEQLTKKVNALRQELDETIIKIEKLEKNMDLISNPREFELLNKEITDATMKENQLRKELKAEEQKYGEAESEVQTIESLIQRQEEEIQQKKQKIANDEAGFKARIAELQILEKQTTKDIDVEILFKFERIVRSKEGIGIVPIRKNVCTGCSMILPPQFVNEIQQKNKIIFCPYCSRVLFYEEEKSEQPGAEIEFGILSDLEELQDFDDSGDLDISENDDDYNENDLDDEE